MPQGTAWCLFVSVNTASNSAWPVLWQHRVCQYPQLVTIQLNSSLVQIPIILSRSLPTKQYVVIRTRYHILTQLCCLLSVTREVNVLRAEMDHMKHFEKWAVYWHFAKLWQFIDVIYFIICICIVTRKMIHVKRWWLIVRVKYDVAVTSQFWLCIDITYLVI